MKRYLIPLSVITMTLIIVVFPSLLMAQPPDGGCDPLDPACPIDGGLSLLIAAGIGLGAKRAFHKK
ncbi:MAG: hypothetical protein RL582_1103 [Bacteroidota bacterium]|jgi:hypothetical protein